MSIEQINIHVGGASAFMRAVYPGVEECSRALISFAREISKVGGLAAELGLIVRDLNAFDHAEARRLTLRAQLKRKGRPGWKRVKRR